MKNGRTDVRIINPLREMESKPSLAPNIAAMERFLKTTEEPIEDLRQGNLYHMEINRINTHGQPRKYFDPQSLEELSQSIKERGVLQPILITKNQSGEIELVAGERRLRAAKMAGLTKIPAIVVSGHPIEISLVENLQRETLRPTEEAEALSQMMAEYDYTLDDLSRVMNKAKSTLSETLSLNRLPEAIKDEIRHAELYPKRLLVEIAKEKTTELMISLFNKVKEKNLTSSQMREITRQLKRNSRSREQYATKRISSLMAYLKELDRQELPLISNELMELKSLIEEILGQL